MLSVFSILQALVLPRPPWRRCQTPRPSKPGRRRTLRRWGARISSSLRWQEAAWWQPEIPGTVARSWVRRRGWSWSVPGSRQNWESWWRDLLEPGPQPHSASSWLVCPNTWGTSTKLHPILLFTFTFTLFKNDTLSFVIPVLYKKIC